jgi:hypothetical protein
MFFRYNCLSLQSSPFSLLRQFRLYIHGDIFRIYHKFYDFDDSLIESEASRIVFEIHLPFLGHHTILRR